MSIQDLDFPKDLERCSARPGIPDWKVCIILISASKQTDTESSALPKGRTGGSKTGSGTKKRRAPLGETRRFRREIRGLPRSKTRVGSKADEGTLLRTQSLPGSVRAGQPAPPENARSSLRRRPAVRGAFSPARSGRSGCRRQTRPECPVRCLRYAGSLSPAGAA